MTTDVRSRKVRGLLREVDRLAAELERMNRALTKLEPRRRKIAALANDIRARRDTLTGGQLGQFHHVHPDLAPLLVRAGEVVGALDTARDAAS